MCDYLHFRSYFVDISARNEILKFILKFKIHYMTAYIFICFLTLFISIDSDSFY